MHLFWRTLGIQKLLQEDVWKVFIKQIEVSEINKKRGLLWKKEREITSNGFAGKGRYDLLLKPKNVLEEREGIIFELKIVNANSDEKFSGDKLKEKLEKECEVALNQIDEKKYVSVLKNTGVERILKIGIAFFGKEFEIKFERE